MNAAVIKTCSCKREYTREQWEALPGKKPQTFDWGEVHEMRNCPCGSTIVLVLDDGEQQQPAAGDVWKEKEGAARIRITKIHGTGVSYASYPRRVKSRGFMDYADFYKTFTPVRRTS